MRTFCMMACAVAACAIGAMLGGCGGGAGSRAGAEFVLVYLKTGPTKPSPEQSKEVFAGHMANMKRLADEGKLIIAGPFARPRDKSWRGIFVFDTPSVEAAKAWTATDPGVVSGVFATEMRAMRASPSLRRVLELEKALPKTETEPGKPPANIRGYVMVTAEDAETAEIAIAASRFAGRVVWCGRFGDAAGGGVFVLDAEKAEEVAGELMGFGVDGWWSTTSLMGLPAEARELP